MGGLQGLETFAWVVAWTHEWSPQWASNFVYTSADISNSAGQVASALSRADSLSANVIWSPNDRIDVGLEYLFGKRTDNDGSTGEANRLQLGFWYYLP